MGKFALTSEFGVSYPLVQFTDDSDLPYGLVLGSAVYVGIDNGGESIAEINIAPSAAAIGEFFENLIPASLRHLATALTEKADEIENARNSGASEAGAFMAAFGSKEGKR